MHYIIFTGILLSKHFKRSRWLPFISQSASNLVFKISTAEKPTTHAR